MLTNTEKCIQCGACREECPFELIVEGKDGYPKLRLAAKRLCIACGHCVAVCPTEALTLPDLPVAPEQGPEDCAFMAKKLGVTPEMAEQFLQSRRSIRNYKSKLVSPGMLDNLIQLAGYAPNAHNARSVSWTVTASKEATMRLSGLVVDYMHENGVFPGIKKWWDKGRDVVLRGAPHVAVAHAHEDGLYPAEDCAAAASYLELAAYANGLGACWAGFLIETATKSAPLQQALKLPEGHRVYAAIMLGYPKFRYRRIPRRGPSKLEWLYE